MSGQRLTDHLQKQLADLRAKGLYKRERRLESPQGSSIRVGGREVINFCANNYLGLANHPAILDAARQGLQQHGYGMASVRFICGTQDIHKQFEAEKIWTALETLYRNDLSAGELLAEIRKQRGKQ